ncbi:MAG: peptidase S8 [Muricauda sp.]|nr:peptidase S8 [Allomuricauda sp.]
MDYKYTVSRTVQIVLFASVLFCTAQLSAQSKDHKKFIQSAYKAKEIQTLASKMRADYDAKHIRLQQFAKENGLPMTAKLSDGTVVSLQDIGVDGTPLFYTTFMDPTSKVSRANELYAGGNLNLDLDGRGLQVGVWDAGIALTSHQEFGARAIKGDAVDEVSAHATMVTGTLISSGVNKKAKGVAFAAEALTHDWTRDKVEVIETAAQGMLLSNHSYGIKSDRVPDWYFGSYIKVSQEWDEIMYNAPYYLMVTAAGNAQNSYDNEVPVYGKAKDGFDLLLGFAVSKNGITVAGANTRIDDKGELKSATVASYSSFGPVDDGRIKPDLAGDGTAVFAASSYGNQSYDSSTGTSMATPGVTGSLLLLQQYHEQLYGTYMKAATFKGLALHTADDVAAAGPDYKMGWGVLNVKKAAEVLKNKEYSSIVNEATLTNGEVYTITVKADGNQPLLASISWTDPKGEFVNRGNLNDATAALTNDLDIRITKDGKTYFPWKLNPAKAADKAIKGDNLVDPYERIDIGDAAGEYTITVTHKGNLVNGAQDFSLIVSGAELTQCRVVAPNGLQLTSATEAVAKFGWDAAEDTLFEIQYKEKGQTEWVTGHTWENTWNIPDLEKGKTYEMRLRAVCTENLVSEFSDVLEFMFNGEATEQTLAYEPLSYPTELSISLYPNPAVNELTVNAELSSDAEFSVVTVSGNIIKKGKINGAINVSDLSSGLYVLMVQDHSGLKSSKFYKN